MKNCEKVLLLSVIKRLKRAVMEDKSRELYFQYLRHRLARSLGKK